VSARPIERWSPATTRRAWASSSSHARAFTTSPRSPSTGAGSAPTGALCSRRSRTAVMTSRAQEPGRRLALCRARRPRPWGQKNAQGLHNRRCCLCQTPAQPHKQRTQGRARRRVKRQSVRTGRRPPRRGALDAARTCPTLPRWVWTGCRLPRSGTTFKGRCGQARPRGVPSSSTPPREPWGSSDDRAAGFSHNAATARAAGSGAG
jgi:hypothetical protein